MSSPASSPATMPPLPVSDTDPTPPPLLPAASPLASATPFNSPASPSISLVPASSPPISSDEPTDPPLSSPILPLPTKPPPSPAVASASPPPPLPFPSPPETVNFPPAVTSRAHSTPASPNPTVTPFVSFFYPPPPAIPVILPFTPLSPSLPASAPETQMPSSENPRVTSDGQIPPEPSVGVLPLAVEAWKLPTFNMSNGIIIGAITGGVIFLVFVLAVVLFLRARRCRHKRKKKLVLVESSSHNNVESRGTHVIRVEENPVSVASGSVKSVPENQIPNHAQSIGLSSCMNGVFGYEELVTATCGFSEANVLGEGGFGYVYKGVLPSGNKEIAVKKLKTGSQQGDREFQAEVDTISRVHHKNLVELVGYCVTRADRLLVYEFVPNDTLESHLHGEGRPVIEWATRVKIALGSARGLAYLHEDCNPAIIHRDIKASNILLDFKFEAKVSDFGLAKIFPNNDTCVTHLTTRVVGTFGYLAPEYASSGKLTDKSDVYSFGVVLLELITGRPPITATESSRNQSLVDWSRPLLAKALQDGEFSNLVDPRLQKNYRDDEMTRMITCAAACVRHSARLRPRMTQIVGALEGLVSLADLTECNRPGYNKLLSWSGSSNYDNNKYQEDIRNFNLALSSQKYSSCGNSESTSAYGLQPSDSSSENSIQNET